MSNKNKEERWGEQPCFVEGSHDLLCFVGSDNVHMQIKVLGQLKSSRCVINCFITKCLICWWLEELPKRFSEDLTHEISSLFWDIFFVTFLKCIKVTHKCFRRGLKRGRLNQTSETLKIFFFQFCWRGYFAHVSITYAIVSHLGCQPLLKITKMAAISLNLMIGTCNKNWTPLSLG